MKRHRVDGIPRRSAMDCSTRLGEEARDWYTVEPCCGALADSAVEASSGTARRPRDGDDYI